MKERQNSRKSLTRCYRVWFKDGNCSLVDAQDEAGAKSEAMYWKRRHGEPDASIKKVELV
jgi:hypothetical protein